MELIGSGGSSPRSLCVSSHTTGGSSLALAASFSKKWCHRVGGVVCRTFVRTFVFFRYSRVERAVINVKKKEKKRVLQCDVSCCGE